MRSRIGALAVILALIALGAVSAKMLLSRWPERAAERKVLEPAHEGRKADRSLANKEESLPVKKEGAARVPDGALPGRSSSRTDETQKGGLMSGKTLSARDTKDQGKHSGPSVTPNEAPPEFLTDPEPLPQLAGKPKIQSDDQKVSQPGSRLLSRGQSGSPELSGGREEADKKIEEDHRGGLVIPPEKQRELIRRYMEALNYLNE